MRLGYSQWKRRGNDLEICLEKVRFNLERLEKSLMFVERKKRDFIAVNGDDLVRNPTMITKKVCAFTGIEYFPGKERYWEFEHHHLFGSSTQIDHVRAPQNAKYLFSDTPPDFPSGAFKVLNKEFRGVLKTLRQHTISSKPENAAWANFLSRFFKKDLKAPFDARGG